MRVKIFQAFGKDEIARMEQEINDWLEDKPAFKVHHTNTAAASTAYDVGRGEMIQTVIVSVWYEI